MAHLSSINNYLKYIGLWKSHDVVFWFFVAKMHTFSDNPINGLNTAIKRQRLTECTMEKDKLTGNSLRIQHRLNANISPRKAGVDTLISNKVGFKQRKLPKRSCT